MEWIIENAQWIAGLVVTGGTTVWGFLANKKKNKLEEKLKELEVSIRANEVSAGKVDLERRLNEIAVGVVDNVLSVKADELNTIKASYQSQIEQLRQDLEDIELKRDQAAELANGYETLIARLKDYNNYLKGLLDENNIKYENDDAIIKFNK